RAMRLVFLEEFVAEGRALGIEYHHDVFRGVLGGNPSQHVGHAVDCAGRLALRVRQRRQRVKGAIEIGGAVNQHQLRHCVSPCGASSAGGGGGWLSGPFWPQAESESAKSASRNRERDLMTATRRNLRQYKGVAEAGKKEAA